jgi:hypothetical protein
MQGKRQATIVDWSNNVIYRDLRSFEASQVKNDGQHQSCDCEEGRAQQAEVHVHDSQYCRHATDDSDKCCEDRQERSFFERQGD